MLGSGPKISVVVPFYNASASLFAALQSIAFQDFSDFECLMVDNDSRDGSRKIAGEWELRDPRFRLVEEPRQGVLFASNRGCEYARGKYIARMDADDMARPCRLTRTHPIYNESAFYEIKSIYQLDREVLYYEDLPVSGSTFVLTYIGQMDHREKIQSFLEERVYVEGKDYLLGS